VGGGGGDFGEAEVAEGAAVALRLEGGGWDAAAGEEGAQIFQGVERFLAEGVVEGDGGALAGFGVVDETLGNGEGEHFFEAEGLGAELDAVVDPTGGAAGFVFDGAGFEDASAGFADFDDVGLAGEAEPIGPQGEGAEEFPAGAVFEAGQVGVFVVELAEEGVFVVFKDALYVYQSSTARAVKKLVESGEGERISHSIHLNASEFIEWIRS
jgi:hypothetical protein